MNKVNIIVHNNDLPNSVQLGKEIAIDTETMGLNLSRDRLCLLQLKSQNDNTVHLVQFLDKKFHAPNLKALLANKEVTKIFHFARFDICAIYMYLGVICENVFCTKIASKIVRTYTNKHGLKDLTRELLGIELQKDQQTTYWGAKQLSEEQKLYAASDVLYLHALKEKLASMLLNENRYNLAKSCFDFLPTRVILDTLHWGDDNDIFKH